MIREFTKEESLDRFKNIIDHWKAENNAGFFNISISETKFNQTLTRLVDSDNAVLFVEEREAEVVAMLGLTKYLMPYSADVMAAEQFFYILKEYRGTSLCKRFFEAAKEWTKKKEYSHLLFTATNVASDKHDMLCKVYSRFGMEKYQTAYIMEV